MGGDAVMLDRHDGTSWMNRGLEVLAHLRVVADEVFSVTVEAGGARVDAPMHVDSSGQAELVLHLGDGGQLPGAVPGSVVRVSYVHGSSSFRFLSVVNHRATLGRVHIAVPSMVEQRERRASKRLNVYADAGVQLHTDRGMVLKVWDLSGTGVGVVGTAEDVLHAAEGGIRGVLCLSETLRLNVWLDVRHTRELQVPGKIFMGCRLMGCAERDTRAIRSFVDARQSGD